jgi:YebC/PmpR family DNA-binding regulatory protein
MSGHSHWSSIKHQKQTEDLKKSQVFSKISRFITVAVQKQGPTPAGNPALQAALDKAKAVNMPAKSVERAIQRAVSRQEGNLEEVVYEAFGPGKTALIIEAITDNKNRVREHLHKILNQTSGKLAEAGSVKWLFEQKGLIHLPESYNLSDDLELELIEAGAEDIQKQDDHLVIYTKPQDLQQVVESLEKQGYTIDSSSIGWVPKETITLKPGDQKKLDNFLQSIEEEDIQEVYTNAS